MTLLPTRQTNKQNSICNHLQWWVLSSQVIALPIILISLQSEWSHALITRDWYKLWLRPVRLSLHEPGLRVWSDYMRPVRDFRSAWMFIWNMEEVPIFLLWSASLCLLLLNAALLIRIQLKARKKERITPSLLQTNVPRVRERTVKNKGDGGLLQEGLIVGGGKRANITFYYAYKNYVFCPVSKEKAHASQDLKTSWNIPFLFKIYFIC